MEKKVTAFVLSLVVALGTMTTLTYAKGVEESVAKVGSVQDISGNKQEVQDAKNDVNSCDKKNKEIISISNADDLEKIKDRKLVSVYINITADIDMDGKTWNKGIGDETYSNFEDGIVEGNGHKISNLVIASFHGNVGLFCGLYKSKIRNLTLENTGFLFGENIGLLAGISIGSTISNCKTSGFFNSNNNSGGIIGKVTYNNKCNEPTELANCYSNAAIRGNANVAGLVGLNDAKLILSNCEYKQGYLCGDENVGGLVG